MEMNEITDPGISADLWGQWSMSGQRHTHSTDERDAERCGSSSMLWLL